MVKKILQVGDIHIRNFKRLDETKELLKAFIEDCKVTLLKDNTPDEVRIAVVGDTVHSKTDISPECYLLTSWFLRELGKICKTIVIAGNHDISPNASRLDPMTTIFTIRELDNVVYLDKELDYQSGLYEDENIVWRLYSIFDNFEAPQLDPKELKEGATVVGLFHGELNGAKTDTGFACEHGLGVSHFNGDDFTLMGHIHRRQCLKGSKGNKLVYCGSLIQQDFGENISGHGYNIWDVETKEYTPIDLKNDKFGFYTVSLRSEEDLEHNTEEILNL